MQVTYKYNYVTEKVVLRPSWQTTLHGLYTQWRRQHGG